MYYKDREALHELVEVARGILQDNPEAVANHAIKENLIENPDYQKVSKRLRAYDIYIYGDPLSVRFKVGTRWDGVLAATDRGIAYKGWGDRVDSIEAASELGLDEDGRGNYSAFIHLEGEWGIYQDAYYD